MIGHGALQLLRGHRGVGLLANSLLAQEKCKGVLHMSHLWPCTEKHTLSFMSLKVFASTLEDKCRIVEVVIGNSAPALLNNELHNKYS